MMDLTERRVSKQAGNRWAARLLGGRTPSGAANFTAMLVNSGMIEEGAGLDWRGLLALLFAVLSKSAPQGVAAAMAFLPMPAVEFDADAQPHLASHDARLGDFLGAIIMQSHQEILDANWVLTLMSNPFGAEITCGAGPNRRHYVFRTPTDAVAASSVRTAKIIAADVLASLADLLQNGEAAELRRQSDRASHRLTTVSEAI